VVPQIEDLERLALSTRDGAEQLLVVLLRVLARIRVDVQSRLATIFGKYQ
jgi:hypothetical protein